MELLNSIIIGSCIAAIMVTLIFGVIGFKNVSECVGLWLTRPYWSLVNIVEFLSLTIKSVIIVSGLIFHYSPFYLFWPNLCTSMFLIWVSQKKGLPTLIWFHAIWVWLSSVILVQKFL